MIAEHIKTEILHRLRKTEEQEGVRVLMAIESGSRAWGFASPNSDYDVRFIYARKKDWYVAVDFEEKRDVIEYPIVDEIDLNGWDVRKALRLFWKSNPAFVEWIQSPITYTNSGVFRETALELLPQIYSVEQGIYHFRSIAKTNYRGYLRSELVPLKKYFYVLRPLLSIKWLETRQCPAPIEFHRILELVDDKKLLQAINELLEKKKINKEMELSPAIPILNNFIESELSRLESFQPARSIRKAEMTQLNELFHKVLNENTESH
ncbi:nucleotidyltransferase domain-containing protein [Cardiobacterium sp. AH-315-I02]|nr:nucleotidyltransferase domain-containing protein [Cardiobacterium sp. AH-315-I02]